MARLAEYDRDLVLQQAQEVFWRSGYRMTTIGDLVKATGMQPGSLYAAFKSKKQIFLIVLELYSADLLSSIRGVFEQQGSVKTAIAMLLNSVVEQAAQDGDWHGCLLVNTMVELAHVDTEIQQAINQTFAEIEDIMATNIFVAKQKGEISAELDVASLASYVVTCIWGLHAIRGSKPSENKLQGIVENMLRVFN